MTTLVRLQALRHYGGDPPRCVWCGCDDVAQLEIDHIIGGQGQGNAHRNEIRGKLEYWLKRNHYPPGYDVLCRVCHARKSADEREVIMPSRNGAREIWGNSDEALATQIEALAAKSSKSGVLEQALTAYVSGNGQQAGMAGVLKRLHEHTAAIEQLDQTMQRVEGQIARMDDRLTKIEHRQAEIMDVLRRIWDDHQATQKALQHRWRAVFYLILQGHR